MLSDGGPESLSLRRLAEDVGTSTSAVYTLFGGKAELIGAVAHEAEAGFTTAQREAAAAAPDPHAMLLAIGRAYRAWALAHPDLYQVMFGGRVPIAERGGPTPRGFLPLLSCVTALQEGGHFSRDVPAASVAFSVWSCVHGYVSLELAGCVDGVAGRDDADAAFEQHLDFIHAGWAVRF